MAYVYILESKINYRFYIGSTINLKKRLVEHNSGRSKYTRLTKPFKLVFKEEYPTLAEARRIEYKLKRLKNKKILKGIIEDGYIKIEPV